MTSYIIHSWYEGREGKRHAKSRPMTMRELNVAKRNLMKSGVEFDVEEVGRVNKVLIEKERRYEQHTNFPFDDEIPF